MFSEPGAGSDLAGLSMRAVEDGDEWVVNGQKVWTTVAHIARWGMLVTRTDPDLPKHQGLTYFVVDMESSGIDIRPLRQITGEAEFNDVYFSDTRIPDADRIGDRGDGWRIALTTLMNERVAIGGGTMERGEGAISDLVDAWLASDRDPIYRDDVMNLWVQAEAIRLTNLRAAAGRVAGTPGPEGSTAKLAYAELNKKIYELALDLLGPAGMLYGSYEMTQPMPGDDRATGLSERFLRVRANSIEGGTSEIMKNILGERVLGLPGEPRVDRDLPWTEIKRG
jgi:alkylation response protein AidB-like acyl-CoA dehydrogenase